MCNCTSESGPSDHPEMTDRPAASGSISATPVQQLGTATGASMKPDRLSLFAPHLTRRGLEVVCTPIFGTLLPFGLVVQLSLFGKCHREQRIRLLLDLFDSVRARAAGFGSIFLELALQFLITTREEAHAPRP